MKSFSRLLSFQLWLHLLWSGTLIRVLLTQTALWLHTSCSFISSVFSWIISLFALGVFSCSLAFLSSFSFVSTSVSITVLLLIIFGCFSCLLSFFLCIFLSRSALWLFPAFLCFFWANSCFHPVVFLSLFPTFQIWIDFQFYLFVCITFSLLPHSVCSLQRHVPPVCPQDSSVLHSREGQEDQTVGRRQVWAHPDARGDTCLHAFWYLGSSASAQGSSGMLPSHIKCWNAILTRRQLWTRFVKQRVGN